MLRWCVAVLLACTAGLASASTAAADDRAEIGRMLFEHRWVAHDPLSPFGDGLGPVHNADSCVACHHLGGSGGAGRAEHNVDLLTLAPGKKDLATHQRLTALQMRAGKVHPAFAPGRHSSATIVFHHFGTEPEYERWRLGVLGFKLPTDLKSDRAAVVRRTAAETRASDPPVADLPRKAGVTFQLSHRNTPSLFGAGLIDSITDETLLELAKSQAKLSPRTAGRVARTADGNVGRFGWRGQVGTLAEFVLSACAMELGLENPSRRQARNPLYPKASLAGDDLTAAQCDALIAYVAALPAPPRLEPDTPQEAQRVSRGEKLFASCDCIACHVRDVGAAKGIYSDLLLHDLGSALADPAPALRKEGNGPEPGPTGGSAYGGGRVSESLAEESPERREWKTPPLWGVRDSAPYLHDGRARTLVEAIAAHGGQADVSINKFRALDYLSRSYLLDFLDSLGQTPEEPAEVADASP